MKVFESRSKVRGGEGKPERWKFPWAILVIGALILAIIYFIQR